MQAFVNVVCLSSPALSHLVLSCLGLKTNQPVPLTTWSLSMSNHVTNRPNNHYYPLSFTGSKLAHRKAKMPSRSHHPLHEIGDIAGGWV